MDTFELRQVKDQTDKNEMNPLLSADAWLHPSFWGPCLLVWTFWFVIRLRIHEFGLRLDHYYFVSMFNPNNPVFYGIFNRINTY